MINSINAKNHSAAEQLHFQFPITIDPERYIPDYDVCRTVMDITERLGGNLYDFIDYPDCTKAPEYDDLTMLRIVLLAFSLGKYPSLRKMEELCRYDLRFLYVSDWATPSHMTIKRFLDRIKGGAHSLLVSVNRIIESDTDIAVSILSIDGTKFEAYANKFTFIWAKSTKRYYTRLWAKIGRTIEAVNRLFERENIDVRYSVMKEPSVPYALEIIDRLERYMKDAGIKQAKGRGHRKSEWQKLTETLKKQAEKLMGYLIQFDMLDGKNSCSKTDIDASFLHMKYDYYNHTNVFKPGYNIQFGVSSGFIAEVYVSNDANDMNTFIPTVNRFYDDYGFYPSMTPADAGYGSYDNYTFCKENGIELYMKYPGIRAEKKRITDRNRYRAASMRQEDGSYVCPEGFAFEKVSERTETRGLYDRVTERLENMHCGKCPNRSKCTKAKGNRAITVTPRMEEYKKEVRENLSTPVGKELMNFRRIFSEGSFGIVKEDFSDDRLHRRGFDSVEMEITLVAVGFNIRKYNRMQAESAALERQKNREIPSC